MANPQTENGHIRIATEIWEALVRTRIPGEARQVLDLIIRKTYGYHKKADQISTGQIVEATGLARRAVEKARKNLKEWNLIATAKKGGSQILLYCFNKDYEAWKLPPKKAHTTAKKGGKLPPKKAGVLPPKKRDTIDIININDTYTIDKEKHGTHVFLTKQEYQNLISIYGTATIKEYIERLNDYAAQFPPKFAKYQSHSAAMRNWMRRDGMKKLPPKTEVPKEELRHDPELARIIHEGATKLIKRSEEAMK